MLCVMVTAAECDLSTVCLLTSLLDSDTVQCVLMDSLAHSGEMVRFECCPRSLSELLYGTMSGKNVTMLQKVISCRFRMRG